MTDRDLLALDIAGLIPGPGETEEKFLLRVQETKSRYEEGEKIPEAHWDWVRELLYELFHVKPLYISAFYSNKGLTPWQGGASWIENKKLKAIQLRQNLKKGSYLKIYNREEILAHEAVHAARSAFNEDASEEFFAYMTSEKKYRRILGPIFRRPWEAWPLLLFVLGGSIWPPLYLCASFWIALGFFRLMRHHLRLKRAAALILQKTKDARTTRAVLFRMTDEEIQIFSKKNLSIDLFAKKQNCLRWIVIRHYLEGNLWQKKSL